MNDAALSITPRYLAASSVEDHHAHLVHLARTAAWTRQATALTTTAPSPCGLVTVHADRPGNPDAPHLFLSARTHPDRPARWKATLGGDLPVEFLAAMTTVLSAELLRDPDYMHPRRQARAQTDPVPPRPGRRLPDRHRSDHGSLTDITHSSSVASTTQPWLCLRFWTAVVHRFGRRLDRGGVDVHENRRRLPARPDPRRPRRTGRHRRTRGPRLHLRDL
uniref:DUF317 domain-containing protein n=1 Tax=Actinacidiphila yanglinensis TaxID=310779 RepID=UPI0038991752